MSTAIIIEQIKSGATALTLPEKMTDQQIAESHTAIELLDSRINWIRGDFYCHVAKIRPTKRAESDVRQLSFDMPVEQNERVQMMMADSSRAHSVHRTAARVSSLLPPADRRPGISWEMHAVILEECGCFIEADIKRRGEALKLAHGFLDHVVEERDVEGEELSVSEVRQMIRTTRAREVKPVAPAEPCVGNSAVGNVLREVQTLNIEVRKIRPAELSPHERESLAETLRELIAFYQTIQA